MNTFLALQEFPKAPALSRIALPLWWDPRLGTRAFNRDFRPILDGDV
jgi:hypothetical protein